MKVRFFETRAGHQFVFVKGKEYDLPRNDALDWIRYGCAELVQDESAPIIQEIKKKATRPVRRTVRA